MAFCSQCGYQLPADSRFCTKCGHPVEEPRLASKRGPPPLPSIPPPASSPPVVPASATASSRAVAAPIDVYGSFLRRFLAFLIDYVVVLLLIGLVAGILSLSDNNANDDGSRFLIIFASIWLYKTVLDSSQWQGTVGKRLLGIRISDLNGRRIGFGRANGRFFAQLLSQISFGIGYLCSAFTKRGQALHDLIAGTLVVKKGVTSGEIINNPRRRGESGVVLAVVIAVGMIGLIGILAAIAIPAYQNYTIRSQITEGLVAADSIKVAVAEAAVQGVPWSQIDAKSLDVRTPVGLQYVESIDVEYGVIIINYGRNANQKIQGMKLVLTPATNARGDVLWTCGTARVPADATPVTEISAKHTTVSNAYLPTSCRS